MHVILFYIYISTIIGQISVNAPGNCDSYGLYSWFNMKSSVYLNDIYSRCLYISSKQCGIKVFLWKAWYSEFSVKFSILKKYSYAGYFRIKVFLYKMIWKTIMVGTGHYNCHVSVQVICPLLLVLEILYQMFWYRMISK